jgi:hypothetical protein
MGRPPQHFCHSSMCGAGKLNAFSTTVPCHRSKRLSLQPPTSDPLILFIGTFESALARRDEAAPTSVTLSHCAFCGSRPHKVRQSYEPDLKARWPIICQHRKLQPNAIPGPWLRVHGRNFTTHNLNEFNNAKSREETRWIAET